MVLGSQAVPWWQMCCLLNRHVAAMVEHPLAGSVSDTDNLQHLSANVHVTQFGQICKCCHSSVGVRMPQGMQRNLKAGTEKSVEKYSAHRPHLQQPLKMALRTAVTAVQV